VSNRTKILTALVGCILLASCARAPGPEEVALEYARALYASDAAHAYRLISAEDRRMKDEQMFLQERGTVKGFALEVGRQLASFITATPIEKTATGERTTVKLELRLPDANAPEIAALVYAWDERRLNALSKAEQRQIIQKLNDLHQARQLPMLEGEESFELVREASVWRVFLDWAHGVRVRFRASIKDAIPVDVTVSPGEVRATPGERVGVTVRVENRSRGDIVTRVGHRIEPRTQADALALLQCPLFVPVTLKAGEVEEFRSVYMVMKDVPDKAKEFQVTYEFLPVSAALETGAKAR